MWWNEHIHKSSDLGEPREANRSDKRNRMRERKKEKYRNFISIANMLVMYEHIAELFILRADHTSCGMCATVL